MRLLCYACMLAFVTAPDLASAFDTALVAKPISPMPKTDPAKWITAGDYPTTSRINGRGGSVSFKLEIDRKGIVTACDITQSSGHRDLDEATCRVLATRGEFLPARDAKGKRALGAYSGTIVWEPKRA